MAKYVFKLCSWADWQKACVTGVLNMSVVDAQDGFVHLSTAHQVQETAAKHFAGQTGLVLLAINENHLGEALEYEPSRGGDLFPHLYGPLLPSSVDWAKQVRSRADGVPEIDQLLAD